VGARDLAVDVLIGIGVLGEVSCVLGLLLGRTALDKLRYVGAATSVPPFLFAAAVVVKEEGTQPALNAIVVAVLLLVLGAVLNEATTAVTRGRDAEAP
jgi:hypothetical protein